LQQGKTVGVQYFAVPIPYLQLIGRTANSGRSSRIILMASLSELLSLTESPPGTLFRATQAGKTGIEILPVRSHGTVFSGGVVVSGEAADGL